ncbi:IS110 family transposase [Halomonas beimenensis]|uniref:Mobile element protein n=2 Tax=Halomonas beimenensis TaxID=475662 RepID=A0A291P7X9_9GAMM|nr:IS110 family transposase [Halomonas beimenensis]ATJ82348.1 mobile element protein [Halomonas beimenensis]ATJ82958.1 mobile element protein [Halomonas beimenensis]ATJ84677.1 mobile element protein [Halomonas beimenensis]
MAHIGIDIGKKKLDCLWLRDMEKGKVKTKVFTNRHQDYPALLDWLTRQTGESPEALHVYMEATGIYHEPLAYWLHEAGVNVYVLNPAHAHHYAKSAGRLHKTDKADSRVLAEFGASRSHRRWTPEPEETRELKRLVARLEAVYQDIQREKNRLEKAQFSRDTGAETSIGHVLAALEREAKRLQEEIETHLDRHDHLKRDRQLLMSIPGIGPGLSTRLVAVLRSRPFESARQAAAFLGLVPTYYTSGTSVKKTPTLSKTGSAVMRRKLYMGAVVAMTHNPDIQAQYARLKARGKHSMSALGAAMRKLVHIAYGVLKTQTEYRPQPIPAGG